MSDIEISPGSIEENKDARLWAMLCHLAAFVGVIGVPLGSVVGPLVLWLIKKNDHEFVNHQGKEALNFQITVLIAVIIGALLTFILIGVAILFVVIIADIVYTIMAAIAANKGERYRYPYSIRFIK